MDDTVEYLLLDVLDLKRDHPLILKLEQCGYTRFDQFISITRDEISTLDLRLADKSLLNTFLNFVISKLQEYGQDIYSLPEDWWADIDRISFRKYRSNLILSSQPRTRPSTSETIPSPHTTPRFKNGNFEIPNPSPRNVTQRENTRPSSLSTTTSMQTINPLMKKVQRISDFPTFNGSPREWKYFERTFIAVAKSQNFGHVLQVNPLFVPTLGQEEEFKLDFTYIYTAFSAAWCKGTNYDIVDKHKDTCDGRQVYLDALDYYRSRAFTVVELQDAITELVNNKFTHVTHDGAAGYNSKFNEAVNTITQIGHTLDHSIVKYHMMERPVIIVNSTKRSTRLLRLDILWIIASSNVYTLPTSMTHFMIPSRIKRVLIA